MSDQRASELLSRRRPPSSLFQNPSTTSVLIIIVSGSEELKTKFGLVAERKGGCSSDSFIGVDVGSQLGSVSLVSITLSSGTAYAGAGADYTSVDSTRDAVIHLDVDLGQVEEFWTVG